MNDRLEALWDQSLREGAATYLTSEELIPFCELAVARGKGIAGMEAYRAPDSKAPNNFGYEIQGLDGDESWDRHFDPERSLELVRKKLASAKEDGAELIYTVWLGTP